MVGGVYVCLFINAYSACLRESSLLRSNLFVLAFCGGVLPCHNYCLVTHTRIENGIKQCTPLPTLVFSPLQLLLLFWGMGSGYSSSMSFWWDKHGMHRGTRIFGSHDSYRLTDLGDCVLQVVVSEGVGECPAHALKNARSN